MYVDEWIEIDTYVYIYYMYIYGKYVYVYIWYICICIYQWGKINYNKLLKNAQCSDLVRDNWLRDHLQQRSCHSITLCFMGLLLNLRNEYNKY